MCALHYCVLTCIQVSYKEPTPPDTELVVRSHVVAVRENQAPGLGKAAVEVDVAILLPQPDGSEKLLVQVRVFGGAGRGPRSEAACVHWRAVGAVVVVRGCGQDELESSL